MDIDEIASAGIHAMTTVGIYGTTAKVAKHAIDSMTKETKHTPKKKTYKKSKSKNKWW